MADTYFVLSENNMQHTIPKIPKSLLVQRMKGGKKQQQPHMKTTVKTREQGCAMLEKAKTFKAGWWSPERRTRLFEL